MKPHTGTWKAAGEAYSSPAGPQPSKGLRTITDRVEGDYKGGGTPPSATAHFNFGRHRWLGLVARDQILPGAAHRVAIVLWEKLNAERGYAWPSLVYLATELNMHKSTVIRSLRALQERGWVVCRRRGGRNRSNEYRIAFGNTDAET